MSSPQQQEQQQPDFPLSTHSPGALEVRKVRFEVDTEGESGRGVFTTIDIPRGTLVEAAHAVKIEKKEYDDHLNKTCLEHYVYSAPSWNGDMWLALGIGSLFNHADPPNLDYRISEKDQMVRYFAAREIKKGEELCIYYGRAVWWDAESTDPKLKEEKRRKAMEEYEKETMPFGGGSGSDVDE